MAPKKRTGARTKLRQYFLKNLGRVMGSDELREVAGGITEWARRVRELRNEEGFQILSNTIHVFAIDIYLLGYMNCVALFLAF